ncbi:MAG: hypothetical protein SGARI_001285 [Bacillariaceae sp.]
MAHGNGSIGYRIATQGQMTLLGVSNAGLLEKVVNTFLHDINLDDCVIRKTSCKPAAVMEEKAGNVYQSQSVGYNDELEEPFERDEDLGDTHAESYPTDLPKFHINSGASAGKVAFRKAFRQIRHLYSLFADKDVSMKLPAKDFPDFEGFKVTWESFLDECREFEYHQYNVASGIIKKFQHETMEFVPKGMEWDNVQLCDDFSSLVEFSNNGARYTEVSPGTMKKMDGEFWQFGLSEYSDGINLLYVGTTRAKKLLSVPSAIVDLLQHFDKVYDWVLTNERSLNEAVFLRPLVFNGKRMEVEDIPAIFKDLVVPFREEQGLTEGQMSVSSLIQGFSDSETTGSKIRAHSRIVSPPSLKNEPDASQASSPARKRLFDTCKVTKTSRSAKKQRSSQASSKMTQMKLTDFMRSP